MSPVMGLSARSFRVLVEDHRKLRRVVTELTRREAIGRGARGKAAIRFGVTAAVSEEYPSAPANVFEFKFATRSYEVDLGEAEIDLTAWTKRIRKASSIDGGYLAEGTLVKVLSIGNRLWLEPFAGVVNGVSSGAITARSGDTLGSGSVLVKRFLSDGTWETVQVGPEGEEEDLVIDVYSSFTSGVADAKAVVCQRGANSGVMGLVSADCG